MTLTTKTLVTTASLLLLGCSSVSAAPPKELEWTPCDIGDGSLCADIEICQDGDKYGYRTPGDNSIPCGSVPGPLWRMDKGKTYSVTLHNRGNTVTNTHTHGLHVVGSGDSDDVTRLAEPGECLTYTYNILEDHPSGTYWYHPHKHGTTAPQTAGGAFGMIIVNEEANSVPEWATIDNELVLQISNSTDGHVYGNGELSETFDLVGDKWYRLRVSVVTPDASPGEVSFDDGCDVFKVASDGIWHAQSFDTYGGSSFGVTGASRGDFAIKCSKDSGIRWARNGSTSNPRAAIFSVTGSEGDTSSTPPGQAPPRPASIDTSIRDAFVPEENKMEIVLRGSDLTINGKQWDENVPLNTIAWNEVHEWNLKGSGFHPFHLHLYHMMPLEDCGMHKAGEFYDTISSPDDCKVRFVSVDFGGRTVMHCHILNHEDRGMMSWVDVQGDGMPINVNDGSAYQCPDPSRKRFLRGVRV